MMRYFFRDLTGLEVRGTVLGAAERLFTSSVVSGGAKRQPMLSAGGSVDVTELT